MYLTAIYYVDNPSRRLLRSLLRANGFIFVVSIINETRNLYSNDGHRILTLFLSTIRFFHTLLRRNDKLAQQPPIIRFNKTNPDANITRSQIP
jgi:hypothetical protein